MHFYINDEESIKYVYDNTIYSSTSSIYSTDIFNSSSDAVFDNILEEDWIHGSICTIIIKLGVDATKLTDTHNIIVHGDNPTLFSLRKNTLTVNSTSYNFTQLSGDENIIKIYYNDQSSRLIVTINDVHWKFKWFK